MGYSTDFDGALTVSGDNAALDKFDVWMDELCETRHGGDWEVWAGYPGFYCQWVFDRKTCTIEWDGGEKFYEYIEWLEFVLRKCNELNLSADGKISWQGDGHQDRGKITVKKNQITVKKSQAVDTYEFVVKYK